MPSHSKKKCSQKNSAPRHCVGNLNNAPRNHSNKMCIMYRPPGQRTSRRTGTFPRPSPYDNEYASTICRRRFDHHHHRPCGSHDLVCPFHGNEYRPPGYNRTEPSRDCPLVREFRETPCQTDNVRIIVREYIRPPGRGPCYEEDIFINEPGDYPAPCVPTPCNIVSSGTQTEPSCQHHSPQTIYPEPICPPVSYDRSICPKVSTSCQNIPSRRNSSTLCPRRSVSFSSALANCDGCEDDLPSYPCVPTPYDLFSRTCQTRESSCKYKTTDNRESEKDRRASAGSSYESCYRPDIPDGEDNEKRDNPDSRVSSRRSSCESFCRQAISDTGGNCEMRENIDRRDSARSNQKSDSLHSTASTSRTSRSSRSSRQGISDAEEMRDNRDRTVSNRSSCGSCCRHGGRHHETRNSKDRGNSNRTSRSEYPCEDKTEDDSESDESSRKHKKKMDKKEKKKKDKDLKKKDHKKEIKKEEITCECSPSATSANKDKQTKKMKKGKDKKGSQSDEEEKGSKKKPSKVKEEKSSTKVVCYCDETKSLKVSKSSSKSSHREKKPLKSSKGLKADCVCETESSFNKMKEQAVPDEEHAPAPPPLAGCQCIYPAAYSHLSCFANVFGNCFCNDD